MNSINRRSGRIFDDAVARGLLFSSVAAALLAGAGVAYGGPCTAQIAALEEQISTNPPGPKTGPTFSQTLGAQLHHQPTPEDVEQAQGIARKQVKAALKAAHEADAADNASACDAALTEAKRLYDISQ